MPFHLTEEQLNEPVAGHLRSDFTTLYPHWSVSEALEHMRRHPPPGRIIYFYVVDESMRLVGVVPTRRLLLTESGKTISEIMIKNVVAIPDDASVLEACEFFTLHRLLAFPVVDAGRRLIGVVDVDLYTEELADTGEEGAAGRDDLFQLIGVRLTRSQQARPFVAFRGRFPWLLCNIAGGALAAILADLYHVQLNWQHAVLAIFIPVVLALSESVAIQSVTLTLDSMRGTSPTWGDLFKRCRHELMTGLLLGVATGLLVASLATLWQGIPVFFLGIPVLFLILLGGIAIGVTGGAVCGLAIPYILHLMSRDPQVAAGPIALASADVIVLLAYFNLALLLT